MCLIRKKIDNIGESGIRQSFTAVQVVLSEIHIKRHIHVVNIFILIVVSHFRRSYLLNINLLDVIFDYCILFEY